MITAYLLDPDQERGDLNQALTLLDEGLRVAIFNRPISNRSRPLFENIVR